DMYDDLDPALWYRGEWTHNTSLEQPIFHSVTYSSQPGAEIVIAFEGTALTWMYTKAPDRGVASVVIDGVPQGDFDLYSDPTQWQVRSRFCCFSPGKHEAVIRVLGKHSPGSTGNVVDLDSIVVE